METQDLARAFKAMGDENRLKILCMIAEQDDICACHLLEAFDFTQPTLSHHIKILCAADLISCRKEGKWMHYTLNRERCAALGGYLLELQQATS